MKKTLLSLLAAVLSLTASATAQYHERLIVGNDTLNMGNNLLEQSPYFQKIKPRIDNTPKIITSNLWRGYIGTWRLSGDSLFLEKISIEKWCKNELGKSFVLLEEIKIDDIITSGKTPSGYFADWVTDTLNIDSGECVLYIHDAWLSRYEHERKIAIVNGIAKGSSEIHNRRVSRHNSPDSKVLEWAEKFPWDRFPFLDDVENFFIAVKYTDFDKDGNLVDTKINFHRLPERITHPQIEEIREFLKTGLAKMRLMDISFIDGKYTSDGYYMVPFKRKSETSTKRNRLTGQ